MSAPAVETYPASAVPYSARIVSVYLSGDDPMSAAHDVAAELEAALDTLGSTILPSVGRWRGEAEVGAVVEIAHRDDQRQALARIADALAYLRDRMGLTFYVTDTAATAMEVYLVRNSR
jgi:hypothetical protein